MNARTLLLPALVLPLFFATACVEDVGTGKAVAELTDVAPPAAKVDGQDIPVDTARSKVQALAAKITAKHPIVFDTWSGSLRLADGDVVGLNIEVQMATLRADVDKLTGHLKTADFFDVETFPTATFESSSVTAGAADGATHTVAGALTIHGVTKQVTFPATIATSPTEVSAKTEFVVDRRDFGLVYPGMPDDLIQDNVVLTIELVADPKARAPIDPTE